MTKSNIQRPMKDLPDLYAPTAEVLKDHNFMDVFEEQEARREAWIQKRLGKFTASEFHRLTAGINDTQEEAIKKMTNSKSPPFKDELFARAEELGIKFISPSPKKEEIVRAIYENGHGPKYGVDLWPDGAETYVIEKVVEELTGQPAKEEINTPAIRHGNEYEVEAVNRLSKEIRTKITRTGDNQEFIDHEHEDFDGSIPATLAVHIGCTPDGRLPEKAGAETKCPNQTTHFKYLMGLTTDNFKKDYQEAYWQCQGTMLITGWEVMFFESYDPRYKDNRDQRHILEIRRDKKDIKLLTKRLTMAVDRKLELLELRKKNRK